MQKFLKTKQTVAKISKDGQTKQRRDGLTDKADYQGPRRVNPVSTISNTYFYPGSKHLFAVVGLYWQITFRIDQMDELQCRKSQAVIWSEYVGFNNLKQFCSIAYDISTLPYKYGT